MRGYVRGTPGLRFIYLAEQADVCALVIGGAVITIVTRDLYRRSWSPIMPGDIVEPIYAQSGQAPICGIEEAA
jgi:hypothetical protein